MPKCLFFSRSVAIVALILLIVFPAVPITQQRGQQRGDVFSSGGACREQAPFDCRCPTRRDGLLRGEDQRNRGRVNFIRGNLQRAEHNLERGLELSNNARERQRVQRIYDQEIKTWTNALREEERLYGCRVAEIRKGCVSGWEQSCSPTQSARNDGGPLPPRTPNPRPNHEKPDPFPMGNPDYWRGFSDGMNECSQGLGELGSRLTKAIEYMSRRDFEQAAETLGAKTSDAALKAMAEGLRLLWEDFRSGRSVPLPGKPFPTPYDIGKHGAERLCLLGLTPAAGNCALQGTVCAVRGSVSVCGSVLKKVMVLRRIGQPKLPQLPSPIHRGLLLHDQKYLHELAASEGKIFIARDSNPNSMRWVGRAGYKPKPVDLKGKTLTYEDLKGLPKAEADKYAGLASAKGLSLDERTELLKKGYKIASPGEHEIIRGPKGEKFYSDTDLHGVYNLDGTDGWSEELLEKLQCRFFDRGIQHGPHDNWWLRNDRLRAGLNYGPQVGNGKTLTAIFPDGTRLWITTLSDMKALYRAIGVDWKKVYPHH